MNNETEQQQEEHHERFVTVNRENEKNKTDLRNLKKEIKISTKDNKEKSDEIKRLREENALYSKEIADLKTRITNHESYLEKKEMKINSDKAKIQELEEGV